MSVKQVQAIVNGQAYTLTYNSNTGKYEATVTAPSRSSYRQQRLPTVLIPLGLTHPITMATQLHRNL